jgi:hypothetical protein
MNNDRMASFARLVARCSPLSAASATEYEVRETENAAVDADVFA